MVVLLFSLAEPRRLLRKRQGGCRLRCLVFPLGEGCCRLCPDRLAISQSVRGGSDVIGAGVLQMPGTSQNNPLLHIDTSRVFVSNTEVARIK